jgi:hypothetical protein
LLYQLFDDWLIVFWFAPVKHWMESPPIFRFPLDAALDASEQERRKQIDTDCAAWIISHKQGPMYWLRNWTKTENYQWKDQGLDPVAPFPYKSWPKRSCNIEFDALRQVFNHDLTEDDPPDYLDVMMGYFEDCRTLKERRELRRSYVDSAAYRINLRRQNQSSSTYSLHANCNIHVRRTIKKRAYMVRTEEIMHDIDRTQREMELAVQELQPEQFEFSGQAETWGESSGESSLEGLQPEQFEFQAEAETYGETYGESPLNEAEEMELAAELLEITNEAELDHFLGGLIKRIGGAIGKVVKSPLGRAIGGLLKPLAKAALPIAGRAVGTFFGGPVGGAIGGKLASAAGGLFGLELEGMSAEDREFEVARRFVRFASTATRNAAFAPTNANPNVAAKAAVISAARRLAPGLIRSSNGNGYPSVPGSYSGTGQGTGQFGSYSGTGQGTGQFGSRSRGIWVRRGRRILLLGV